jgi:hypothetical protein
MIRIQGVKIKLIQIHSIPQFHLKLQVRIQSRLQARKIKIILYQKKIVIPMVNKINLISYFSS